MADFPDEKEDNYFGASFAQLLLFLIGFSASGMWTIVNYAGRSDGLENQFSYLEKHELSPAAVAETVRCSPLIFMMLVIMIWRICYMCKTDRVTQSAPIMDSKDDVQDSILDEDGEEIVLATVNLDLLSRGENNASAEGQHYSPVLQPLARSSSHSNVEKDNQASESEYLNPSDFPQTRYGALQPR